MEKRETGKEHYQHEEHENDRIQDHDHGSNDGHGRDSVEITINDTEYTVHRGHTTVTELKLLADINPAWVLYLFGQPEPLDDAGFVIIKGGEVFLASARSGQSS